MVRLDDNDNDDLSVCSVSRTQEKNIYFIQIISIVSVHLIKQGILNLSIKYYTVKIK